MLTPVPVGRFFATPCAPGTGGGVPGEAISHYLGRVRHSLSSLSVKAVPATPSSPPPPPGRARLGRTCSPDLSVLQQRNAVAGSVTASSAVPGLLVVPTKRGHCRSIIPIGFTQDSASQQLLRAAKVLSTLPFHWLKSSRETM